MKIYFNNLINAKTGKILSVNVDDKIFEENKERWMQIGKIASDSGKRLKEALRKAA